MLIVNSWPSKARPPSCNPILSFIFYVFVFIFVFTSWSILWRLLAVGPPPAVGGGIMWSPTLCLLPSSSSSSPLSSSSLSSSESSSSLSESSSSLSESSSSESCLPLSVYSRCTFHHLNLHLLDSVFRSFLFCIFLQLHSLHLHLHWKNSLLQTLVIFACVSDPFVSFDPDVPCTWYRVNDSV